MPLERHGALTFFPSITKKRPKKKPKKSSQKLKINAWSGIRLEVSSMGHWAFAMVLQMEWQNQHGQ
jgi:hypothetical protein